MRYTLSVVLLLSGATLFAQSFDASGNGTLNGTYFVREILFTNVATNGVIGTAQSAIGTIAFDGQGNYQFNGQTFTQGGQPTASQFSGTYQAAANGFVWVQSLLDAGNSVFGGIGAIGPSAIVGSATEPVQQTNEVDYDMFVAIPAGSGVTNASLKGSYSVGFIDFPNGDVTMVRDGSFTMTADGAGNVGALTVSGAGASLGGTQISQNVSGVTYSLTSNGSGTIGLGTASSGQLISGTQNLYLSADGNILMAGSPDGFDLQIGVKSFSGSATNASLNGVFYMAGLEQPQTDSSGDMDLDGFYGSFNANGSGTSYYHFRLNELLYGPTFDLTTDSQYTIAADGTFPTGSSYQNFTGAGGQAVLFVGSGSWYSLGVALHAQNYTGSGVFLNPLGIVSAASYAPITNPVGPNEFVTLFGSNLAQSSTPVKAPAFTASNQSLPTTLAGVRVTVNGTPIPLLYVSSSVIVALVPFEIVSGSGANQVVVPYATFQVNNNNVMSNAVTVYTNYTSPGVFSTTANGVGIAAMRHNDAVGTPVDANHPAAPNEVISIYTTGMGIVTPAVPSGQAAPASPHSTVDTSNAVQVFIAGESSQVHFAGLAPSFAGLYQLNVGVPADAATGNLNLDVETADGATNQTFIPVSGAGSSTSSLQVTPSRRAATLNGRPAMRAPKSRYKGSVKR